MSSFVHIDDKNKDILILGEEPTQVLDDTTLTGEAMQEKEKSTLTGEVCTIMKATVSFLLMLQKYINSKQKTLK